MKKEKKHIQWNNKSGPVLSVSFLGQAQSSRKDACARRNPKNVKNLDKHFKVIPDNFRLGNAMFYFAASVGLARAQPRSATFFRRD